MDAARWTKKNAEQQERHFQRFLQASVRATHAHAVMSSRATQLFWSQQMAERKNQVKRKQTAKNKQYKMP